MTEGQKAGEEVCSLSSSGGTGCSGAGVMARPSFGTLGIGHVKSLSSSGQNGLICSNRYHWRSTLKPRGGVMRGNSCASGDQESFRRSILSSMVSECSFANTNPGVHDDIRKWWYFLTPGSFLKCGAKWSVTWLYTHLLLTPMEHHYNLLTCSPPLQYLSGCPPLFSCRDAQVRTWCGLPLETRGWLWCACLSLWATSGTKALFCPVKLSTCSKTSISSRLWLSKK